MWNRIFEWLVEGVVWAIIGGVTLLALGASVLNLYSEVEEKEADLNE